jgi:hypothetical protein
MADLGLHRDADDQLAALQRLTDSTLTALDVDDLLAELLERVQEVLDADTAAVLLLDESSRQLVARAARGLEEEVRQGVRVPVGAGFAGQVAARRVPIRLDRVDETTVANPILWEKGIRVMLGVPLVSAGRLMGVLHVGRLDDRPFSDDEASLLQVAGDRVAAATHARQLAVERAAAAMLERSLVPSALPTFPGLEFATRYIPTERGVVGGDWYDVFRVPDGALWIVVGDVAGHGLQAAVVMGRIRSALRAYSLLDVPPAEVLDLVDRKVDHFEIGTIATVACAVVRPPFDRVEVALAGHPPPIVAPPGGDAFMLPTLGDPPLGLGSSGRRATAVDLEPGAVVALYTDGLVERRYESIYEGLARLRACVTADEPERVARTIMRRMVGSATTDDDIALVVLRRAD